VKFFCFHLMPYSDLDLSYTEKHNSAWVTLPNSYYDPVKGHALYNRYLDELEYADQLGFDGLCVNEHYMLCCSSCSKEMPLPSALLTQDLNANTVGFCSPSCRDTWYNTTFSTSTPSAAPISAGSAGSSDRHFAPAS
jgi:hypothetical protein